jgi:hypothetical protein
VFPGLWGICLSVQSNASRGHRCWAEALFASGHTVTPNYPLSSHLMGKAMDFSPRDGNIAALKQMVENDIQGNQSLGWRWREAYTLAPTWVHAQTILYPARQWRTNMHTQRHILIVTTICVVLAVVSLLELAPIPMQASGPDVVAQRAYGIGDPDVCSRATVC